MEAGEAYIRTRVMIGTSPRHGPRIIKILGKPPYHRMLGSHMGGCHNYGPFLDPCYKTAPNI